MWRMIFMSVVLVSSTALAQRASVPMPTKKGTTKPAATQESYEEVRSERDFYLKELISLRDEVARLKAATQPANLTLMKKAVAGKGKLQLLLGPERGGPLEVGRTGRVESVTVQRVISDTEIIATIWFLWPNDNIPGHSLSPVESKPVVISGVETTGFADDARAELNRDFEVVGTKKEGVHTFFELKPLDTPASGAR